MNNLFSKVAQRIAKLTGSVWAFFIALTTILVWAVSGPMLNFSNTWQLTINTTTTIVTFLMVFLIQNTQNRDSKAMHLKVDELLRTVRGTRPKLLDTDRMTDEEFEKLHAEFVKISEKYNSALEKKRLRAKKKPKKK